MKQLLFVGAGGGVGAIARYLLSGVVLHHLPAQGFPLGTLLVNVTGCLLIGVFGGLSEHHHLLSPDAKLLLITGLLGGFTTFSAFGYETVFLLRTGQTLFAALNVLLSVTLGLAAVLLGGLLTGVR